MTVQVPFTTTVTSHGLIIRANGVEVGAISSFNTDQARNVTPVFAFGNTVVGSGGDVTPEAGEPYENVPGNMNGLTINVERYDIYTKPFEKAFGVFDLTMLARQDQPIQLVEFLTGPSDNNIKFTYVYHGVWFTRLGRNYAATDDRVVKVSAAVSYTRKRPV